MNNKSFKKFEQYSNVIAHLIGIARRDFTKIQFNAFMAAIGKSCLSETDKFTLKDVISSFQERLNDKK